MVSLGVAAAGMARMVDALHLAALLETASGQKGLADAIARSMAVLEYTLDGRIVAINDHYARVLGYHDEDIVGRPHAVLMDAAEADGPAYQDFWRELRAGRYVKGVYRRLAKDGREVWLQASCNPILDRHNRPSRVIEIATDVTWERRQARQQRGVVAALSRSSALAEYSLQGVIRSCNANFLAMLGYTAWELSGRHHQVLLEPGAATKPDYAVFWERLRAGDVVQGEFRCFGKGGREVWLQGSYNPVFDAAGTPSKIMQIATEITAAVQQRRQNAVLATIDGLTGIANRRSLDLTLNREFNRVTRSGAPLSVLLMDVDNFKAFNDLYGHQQGDRCLAAIAGVLRQSARRSNDCVARYGGEEFMAVLPDTDFLGAAEFAERLRAAVEALALPHRGNGDYRVVTVSIGIATATANAGAASQDVEALVGAADKALYRAKAAGRNRCLGDAEDGFWGDICARDSAAQQARGGDASA